MTQKCSTPIFQVDDFGPAAKRQECRWLNPQSKYSRKQLQHQDIDRRSDIVSLLEIQLRLSEGSPRFIGKKKSQ